MGVGCWMALLLLCVPAGGGRHAVCLPLLLDRSVCTSLVGCPSASPSCPDPASHTDTFVHTYSHTYSHTSYTFFQDTLAPVLHTSNYTLYTQTHRQGNTHGLRYALDLHPRQFATSRYPPPCTTTHRHNSQHRTFPICPYSSGTTPATHAY